MWDQDQDEDQDQDSLLVKRRNGNHSPGQLVPAINLSDRGVEEKICMEFNGNG